MCAIASSPQLKDKVGTMARPHVLTRCCALCWCCARRGHKKLYCFKNYILYLLPKRLMKRMRAYLSSPTLSILNLIAFFSKCVFIEGDGYKYISVTSEDPLFDTFSCGAPYKNDKCAPFTCGRRIVDGLFSESSYEIDWLR